MLMSEEISHRLITTYRKRLWSPFTKAIRDYALIQENDKVAVCISGGKDSFLAAILLRELQHHGPIPFELKFLCLDPGYDEKALSLIKKDAKELDLELEFFSATIFRYVETLKERPCYLCARMRRGNLYHAAETLGCNKIVLGHHYDDVIETILMNLMYAGKYRTMLPKIQSKNFAGMSLIRPLYLIEEKDIQNFWQKQGFEFIHCACTLSEKEGMEDSSKRLAVKKFIAKESKTNPYLKANIFNSAQKVNLETVISYEDGSGIHQQYDPESPHFVSKDKD